MGLIPGLGRSPGGGYGNTLQYFCLENSMARGAWQATVHTVAKSQTRLRYTHTHTHTHTHKVFINSFLDSFSLQVITKYCIQVLVLYNRSWRRDYFAKITTTVKVKVKLLSRVRLFATHGLQPTKLLRPWDSPGKNTGVGCHFLLQGIFLTQRSNLGLLHYRQIF